MRALTEDPVGVPAARYRRFVQRAILCGLLADHLFEGEPYLALNAVVLTADEDARLRGLTETFARAFQRAAAVLAAEVPALIEMGFPWVAAELLHAEGPAVPLAGRFDFVVDDSGRWWLLEYNADTPSGIREAIVADRLVQLLAPEARGLQRPNAGLEGALVGAFQEALRDLAPGQALGLVTDASALEDLAQMGFLRELLRAPLAAAGLEVVLGDADNLRETRSGLTLRGRRIAALYRYVPFEWTLGTPVFSAIFDAAMAGRLRLLNGLYGLLLQHKGLLAWLWEHRDDDRFPEDERRAIQEHLPPTWAIDAAPADVPRTALVAKQVFGREGEEVFFGEDQPPAVWDELRRRRTYAVQQRIATRPIEAALPSFQGPHRSRGHVTVGGYTVGERWAGYYSRFGGKIITSRAKWLATFVEPAE